MSTPLIQKLNAVTIPLLYYIEDRVWEEIPQYGAMTSNLIERSIIDLSLSVQGRVSGLVQHHPINCVLFDKKDLEETDMLQSWAKQAPLDWYVLRLKEIPTGLYLILAIVRNKTTFHKKTVVEMYELTPLREGNYVPPPGGECYSKYLFQDECTMLISEEDGSTSERFVPIPKRDWMLPISAQDYMENDTVVFPLGLIYLYQFQAESVLMLASISNHAHIVDVTMISIAPPRN